MRAWIAPFLCTLLLSACGFHLRGLVDVPSWLNNVAIVDEYNDKQLATILKTQLEGYHIQVNPDPSEASYWLVIKTVARQEQIVSVGSSTNPRQYILVLTVEYTLQTRKGKILRPISAVHATRQLTINNDRILGSNYEESLFTSEMKQDAAIQIINQMSHQHNLRHSEQKARHAN
jgi:LPS-assembly lipoprotein